MGQSQARAGRGRPKPDARHATREEERQERRGDIARPDAGAEEEEERPARGPDMDTFFLSHGSPTLSIDEAIPARHFFKSWLPARVAGDRPPRAILVVSGHWETETPAVNVIRGTNDTIHDFYGFPKPMYQVRSSPAALPAVSSSRVPILLCWGSGFR